MIKLDKWESQLVWMSKGWTDKKEPFEKLLQNLWGNRSGTYSSQVYIGHVASTLVKLVQKVEPNFDLVSFLEKLSPDHLYYSVKYKTNDEFQSRVCWVCLYQYLSILKIRETKDKDEYAEVLIEVQPLELDLFMPIEEEEE